MPKDIHRAFVTGMLIFCMVAGMTYGVLTTHIEIFIPMLLVGFCQSAVLHVTIYFRLHHREVVVPQHRLRYGLFGGFITATITWLTILALTMQLPSQLPAYADWIIPSLAITIPLLYATIAALLLTSGLRASCE